MARPSKWIKDVSPSQRVAEVARTSLTNRIGTVADFLPKAAESADDDIEYVHQLRVATRRSMAAIQTFQSLLPKRRSHKLRKMLRRLRRAAGEARDLDVLHERLRIHAKVSEVRGMKKVLAKVVDRREQAQWPLLEIHRKWKKKNYDQRVQQLLARVRWRSKSPEPTFDLIAASALQPSVNDLFDAASADLENISALHQMRICAKQVRYTMELLAGAFPSEFREELYPMLTEVQDKLGAINDSATAEQIVQAWAAEAKSREAAAELNRMAADEREQLGSASLDFRRWWTPERASEFRQQFAPYLVPRSPQATDADEDEHPPRAVAL